MALIIRAFRSRVNAHGAAMSNPGGGVDFFYTVEYTLYTIRYIGR
jgi:hypothetical protein